MPPEQSAPKPSRAGFFALLALLGVILIAGDLFDLKQADSIPYSQFLTWVDAGKVAEVTLSQDRVHGRLKAPANGQSREFTANRVDDPALVDKLRDKGVQFAGTRESGVLAGLLSWLLPFFFLM